MVPPHQLQGLVDQRLSLALGQVSICLGSVPIDAGRGLHLGLNLVVCRSPISPVGITAFLLPFNVRDHKIGPAPQQFKREYFVSLFGVVLVIVGSCRFRWHRSFL